MSNSFSKKARDKVGFHWAMLVIACLFITFGFGFHCLITWTWSWWFPAFFVFTFVATHRYGTLLDREEKRVEAEEKDRATVS
jgi:hypothetical protein